MKTIALLSSGIDSPVAVYSLAHCVDSFVFVHADNRPFTDDREIRNTIRIAKKLDEITDAEVSMYLVSHGKMLTYLVDLIPKRFTCVLCKRMMLRYADMTAQKEQADALIMGDSLGQVASQTLQNIQTIDDVVKVPVLRPLIGFDKEEIISIAKKIGTFDLSILPSDECTAVPKKPATKASISKIEEIEQDISYEHILKEIVDTAQRINAKGFDSFIDL